ncbi:MAG: universal stress protein, partial [Deltaproteobacteria bacterium]|nr:universal stress protein [Deltaproteobacteria bacterium]
MKRIMVVLESSETNLWSAVHAINLAKRVGGKVYILRVLPAKKIGASMPVPETVEAERQEKLEGLIEQGRSQGIVVDYQISHGNYEDEVVRFIRETKVDILVLTAPHLLRSGRRDRALSI